MTGRARHFKIPRYMFAFASCVLMALICWSSTRPTPHPVMIDRNVMDHVWDFAHFPVYTMLTILLLLSFESMAFHFQVIAFVLASACGVFNELIQLHVPGRSYSVKDMLVNAFGALVAILICRNSKYFKS